MIMLRRLDAWVGRTLFIPLIIKLCQLMRLNQWAFSNYLSVASLYVWLARCPLRDGFDYAFFVIMGVCALFETVAYALYPNLQHKPSFLWRTVSMLFFFLDLFAHGRFWPVWFMWVVREYAREIDTIPPPEAKERKTQVALAPAKVRR